ncbi:MAG: NAD(P)-binding protein [Lentisphaeraceae bacterium]|nr:NAD(P)-binding protein [Lentisphaeraceae bacterium]
MNFETAIVIGGGIAGLLCARVLSDVCKEVLILEKEETPEGFAPRKGIPQGFHNHTLLDSGKRILNEYFPGFSEKLIKNGNATFDQTKGLKWFHHGVIKYNKPTGIMMNIQSRWHLEGLVRQYISEIANIKSLQKKVDDLIIEENTTKGVLCGDEDLHADIVMDCSGPANQIRQWLSKHNFPPPAELRIKIDLKYSSYLYKRNPDDNYDWKALAVYPEAPKGNRSGVVFPIMDKEHGPCWLVTAVGRNGEYAGSTHEEFLEFMKGLDIPDVFECISKWELADEKGHHTSFQENIRTYYDHMLKYPAGFLPCGDSFGRINPIFGQGMSIAALESEILQKTLSEVKDIKTLTSLYLKRIGCFFDIPWFLVNCEDWRYPNVPGRSKEIKYVNWFTGKLHKLCSNDKQIVSEMYNVLHLNKKPSALFKPSIVFKALFKRV